MKAFLFRLEQAMRWREVQVSLQKARVTAAAGRLAEIEALGNARRTELAAAAARIIDSPSGATLESYAGFKDKARMRIRDSEAQALVAQRTLALERNRLFEARQKLRLFENLRHADEVRWRREFDRELAALADEAFLYRFQSKVQSKTGRTGA